MGEENVSIYPNPSAGMLHLKDIEYLSENFEIIVHDTFGKAVMKQKNLPVIDLAAYPDGMYMIRLRTESKTMNYMVLLLR